MHLESLKEIAKTLAGNTRSIERLILSDDFEDAWNMATESEKQHLIRAVENQNRDLLRSFVRQKTNHELELMNIHQLREIGKQLRINQYNVLPKALLIAYIRMERESDTERSSGTTSEDGTPGDDGQGAEEDVQTASEKTGPPYSRGIRAIVSGTIRTSQSLGGCIENLAAAPSS